MNNKILVGIIAIIPLITLTLLIIKYINVITYSAICMTLTNIAIVPTASCCFYFSLIKKKNLWLEFISSYLVVFSSGLYHLCASNDNNPTCISDIYILLNIDLISSYYFAIMLLIHLTKLEYLTNNKLAFQLKCCLHLAALILIIPLQFLNVSQQFIIYILLIFFIPLLAIFFILYSNNKYEEILKYIYSFSLPYLLFGLFCIVISLISYTYLAIVNTYNNYWWIHSFLWHMPVMLGSMFIIEIEDKMCFIKYFILYNNNNYIDLSNFKLDKHESI